MFSQEAREKSSEARRERARQQRLRNPLYSLPGLKVVYLHYHRKTGEYFWCGHGNWKRPYKAGNRTSLWKQYIEKHGKDWEVVIVQSGLDKEVAWWLEKSITVHIGTIHDQQGSLLNHDGKRGSSKKSEEFKQRVRVSVARWHSRRRGLLAECGNTGA